MEFVELHQAEQQGAVGEFRKSHFLVKDGRHDCGRRAQRIPPREMADFKVPDVVGSFGSFPLVRSEKAERWKSAQGAGLELNGT